MREPEPRLLHPPTERDRRIGEFLPKRYSLKMTGRLLVSAGLGIGIGWGLLGRAITEMNQPAPPAQTPQSQSYGLVKGTEEPLYIATIAANTISTNAKMAADVHNALFPTEAPAPVPITNVSTSTPLPNVCSTPIPGKDCLRPTAVPTPTPPNPDCNDVLETPVTYASLCTWPTKIPTQHGTPIPIGNPPNITLYE